VANYDVESHIQKNVLFFVFGTLCSYDPPWRVFFAWRQKTASLKLVQTRQLWVRPWAVLNRWLCRHYKRKKKRWRSKARHFHFHCVFVDYSNKLFYTMIFFSRSYTISSIYYSGRKRALRKTAYLPNQTCVR